MQNSTLSESTGTSHAIRAIEPLQARANLDITIAQVAQAQAELQAGEASVAKAVADLRQAELDLKRTTLYAPFSCEVSEVFIEAGGYVHAGQAVAHLVMMDPIKIDLAVSQDLANRVNLGDTVHLVVPGEEEPISALIYEKATVADPQTRTIRVSIMTRNKRDITPAPDPVNAQVARISRAMRFERQRKGDPTSPYIVEENRALRRDEDGWYVWGLADRESGNSGYRARRSFTLQRAPVTPGERRFNFQGLFLFRVLVDFGNSDHTLRFVWLGCSLVAESSWYPGRCRLNERRDPKWR